MAEKANAEIAALEAEIQQLRADFAKLNDTMSGIAMNGVAGTPNGVAGTGEPYASAEKIWSEVQRQAGSLGREIEERPIAAAFTAFGAGLFLGRLLTARRG